MDLNDCNIRGQDVQNNLIFSDLAIRFLKENRFSKTTINTYRCHRVAIKAKVDLFHPHSCRHYFATELYKRINNIVLVSKLLGHARIETTMQYIDCFGESLKGTTDILD